MTRRNAVRHWEWIILVAILLAGAALRAFYLSELVHEPDFAIPSLDPLFHDYWARALVSGDWTPPGSCMADPKIPYTAYGRSPVYPWFLASVYRIFGPNYLAARVAQMAVGLASCVLLWLFARKMFGRCAALLAAAFMAWYWGFVFFEGELEAPVLEVFFILLFMHAVWAWAAKPNLPRAFLMGLLFGVFILLRGNALLLAPLLLGWMAWVMVRRRPATWKSPARALRRFVFAACVASAGMALAIAPVTIRNYLVSGEFVLITYNGGVNLYMGNNPLTDCAMPLIPELMELTGKRTWTCFDYPDIVQGIAKKLGKKSITYGEANQYFKQKAWDYIMANPGTTLRRMFRKALLFWGPMEITSNKVTHYAKLNSRVLKFIPGFPLVLSLSMLGIILLFAESRRLKRGENAGSETTTGDIALRNEVAAFVIVFVLAYSATFLPFIVSGRFRVPLIPFLLVFGGYAVARVIGMVRLRQLRHAAFALAAAALLYVGCRVPYTPYQPELDYWYLMRGVAYYVKDDLPHASECFEKAINVHGEFTGVTPYLFLADIRGRQNKMDDMVSFFRSGLRTDPESTLKALDALMAGYMANAAKGAPLWTLPLDLGQDIERLGKTDLAITYYSAILAKTPAEPEALKRLAPLLMAQGKATEAARRYVDAGTALAGQRQTDQAPALYEEALRIDPNCRDAAFNLGVMDIYQGKFEEARKHLTRALEIDPADTKAALQLGTALQRLGRAAETEACYRKALEITPGDVELRQALDRLLEIKGQTTK